MSVATQNDMINELKPTLFYEQLTIKDAIWALLVGLSGGFALWKYNPLMDTYEAGILIGSALALIVMGSYWRSIQMLSVAVLGVSLFAFFRYQGVLANAETDFFLKYFCASQSAIMWMSALYVLASGTYFLALLKRSEFMGKTATAFTWTATVMGVAGLMIRWRESYLMGLDIGHVPVSNLYEVFILFSVFTALIYLFYEGRFQTRALGGFVMLLISAAVGFLLWYSFAKNAHEIQPLVPALQSYWMKIHVPANFIGYGCFSIAAMVGVAYLIRSSQLKAGYESSVLPSADVLDSIMYKTIALGFAFFTIATILGAMWAAEAWGGYWSWDPKETWALIVWLNYAAWLHMRMTKGWRGNQMAWWAIIGLFVTLFAFLGVNMFLSGLHSYGEL